MEASPTLFPNSVSTLVSNKFNRSNIVWKARWLHRNDRKQAKIALTLDSCNQITIMDAKNLQQRKTKGKTRLRRHRSLRSFVLNLFGRTLMLSFLTFLRFKDNYRPNEAPGVVLFLQNVSPYR